jgi:hypothetical protein
VLRFRILCTLMTQRCYKTTTSSDHALENCALAEGPFSLSSSRECFLYRMYIKCFYSALLRCLHTVTGQCEGTFRFHRTYFVIESLQLTDLMNCKLLLMLLPVSLPSGTHQSKKCYFKVPFAQIEFFLQFIGGGSSQIWVQCEQKFDL